MFTFDNKYIYILDAVKNKEYSSFNYGKFEENMEEFDEDAHFIPSDLNFDGVIKSARSLHGKHVYGYLRQSIQRFRNSFYAKRVIKDNKIVDLGTNVTINETKVNNVDVFLTLKHFYNFGKFLSFRTMEVGDAVEYIPINKFWKSLKEAEKISILQIIKSDFGSFNIKNNIRNYYNSRNSDFIDNVQNAISNMLRGKFIDFVFEAQIVNGTLSYFSPKYEITDDKNIGRQDDDRKKKMTNILKKSVFRTENNPIWTGSYYYLTGERYCDMKKMIFENKETKVETSMNFFEYNSKNIWYDAFAFDWISQINFFHRYLNNRVIYISGGTGVGKSTQIPKLFLYSLKAVDYKKNGSVMMTAPRITPLLNNSMRISEELGIPIMPKSNDNYIMQYEYKGNQHVKQTHGLMFKIVTDGKFATEMINPLFKRKISDQYIDSNYYDIVIIDESHEHNQHMDMILSMLRNSLYVNNDVKLGIVSATLNSDEPGYRRFFRNVNDNRMYPLSYDIKNYGIDRINVDRRMDISVPGMKTRFKITVEWRPNDDPIEVILSIARTTTTGDILIIYPGQKEIDNALVILNEKLPNNVIALPFYSSLGEYQMRIMNNISDNIVNVKIPRNINFAEITEDENNKYSNKYNRFVIVATNIIEASVTVESLKYVIDTGEQKVKIFDHRIKGNKLKKFPIDESSAIQRMGRVGRTGPGTVYKMYDKNFIQSKKSNYGMTSADLKMEVFSYLSESNDLVLSQNNDPNIRANVNIMNIRNLDKIYSKSLPLFAKVIQKYYFVNQTKGEFYDYFGNDKMRYFGKGPYYDEGIRVNVYLDGYDYQTVSDFEGKFYLIHPCETIIRRNIIGVITGTLDEENVIYDDKKKTIFSHKIDYFWKELYAYMIVGKSKNEKIMLHPMIKNVYNKTRLGSDILSLIREYNSLDLPDTIFESLTLDHIFTIFYGKMYNVQVDVIKVIGIMMCITVATVMKMRNKNKYDSDYQYICQCVRDIDNVLGKYDVNLSCMDSIVKYKSNRREIINMFKKNNMEVCADLIDRYVYFVGKFVGIFVGYVSDIEYGQYYETLLSAIKKILKSCDVDINDVSVMKQYIKNKKNVVAMSKKNEIEPKLIDIYIKNVNLKKKIDTQMFQVYVTRNYEKINKISNMINEAFKDNIDIVSYQNDKIIMSFLMGFSKNIVKRVVGGIYIDVNKFNVNSIGYVTQNKNLYDYVLYLGKNEDTEELYFVCPLTMQYMKYVARLYNKDDYRVLYNERVNVLEDVKITSVRRNNILNNLRTAFLQIYELIMTYGNDNKKIE